MERSQQLRLAFGLIPFAGIAFLWFLGVMRERLGHLEDQFFSTLFLGSGLLYLAMTFAASALVGGILAIHAIEPQYLADTEAAIITLYVSQTINNIYAVRMAGMLMMILGTIWIRTQLAPRWLILVTYGLALSLLLGTGFTRWLVLIFPAWVLVVSIFTLIQSYRFGWSGVESERS